MSIKSTHDYRIGRYFLLLLLLFPPSLLLLLLVKQVRTQGLMLYHVSHSSAFLFASVCFPDRVLCFSPASLRL
jgi:hypothetical protein